MKATERTAQDRLDEARERVIALIEEIEHQACGGAGKPINAYEELIKLAEMLGK